MEEEKFKIGDKVYHVSLSSVAWVIEKIENDLIHCSTLVKETLELKKEKFSFTSIKKVDENSSFYGAVTGRRNNSRY